MHATQTIRPNNMQLRIQSDDSYHSERVSQPAGPAPEECITYFGFDANAAEHLSLVIIPTLVSSAAEAEYAALFINDREGTTQSPHDS